MNLMKTTLNLDGLIGTAYGTNAICNGNVQKGIASILLGHTITCMEAFNTGTHPGKLVQRNLVASAAIYWSNAISNCLIGLKKRSCHQIAKGTAQAVLGVSISQVVKHCIIKRQKSSTNQLLLR